MLHQPTFGSDRCQGHDRRSPASGGRGRGSSASVRESGPRIPRLTAPPVFPDCRGGRPIQGSVRLHGNGGMETTRTRPARRSSRRVTVALWLGLAIVAVTDLVAIDGTVTFIQSARRLEQIRINIIQLTELLSLLKDAETGQRGFLITGDERYLGPYGDAVTALARRTPELRARFARRPHQIERLDALEPLVAAKLAEISRTIELRRTAGFSAAAAVVLTDEGRALMDKIRARVDEMVARERARYDPRREGGGAVWVLGAIVAGALVSLALLLVALSRLARENTRRRQGDEGPPLG